MVDRALLIITHGEFGIEILKSAEMIIGVQEDVVALGLRPGDSVDDLKAQAASIVEENKAKGMETIVLCDLLGGSPSNIAMSLMAKGDISIFTGLNLPMLIEICQLYKTEEDTAEVLESVKSISIEGIKMINRSFLQGH